MGHLPRVMEGVSGDQGEEGEGSESWRVSQVIRGSWERVVSYGGHLNALREGNKVLDFRHLHLPKRLSELSKYPIHPFHTVQMLCLTFCKITKAQAKRIISDDEAEVILSS